MGLTIAALAINDSAAIIARDLLRSIRPTVDGRAMLCLFHAFLADGPGGDPSDGITRIDIADLLCSRQVIDHRTGQPAVSPEAYYRTAPLADRDLKALPLLYPALAGDDVLVVDLDRPALAAAAVELWPSIREHHFFCPLSERSDSQVVLKLGRRIHRFAALKAALERHGLPIARDGVASAMLVGRRATDRGRAIAAVYDRLLRDKPVLLPGLADYFTADLYLTAALSQLSPEEIAALPTQRQIEDLAGPPGREPAVFAAPPVPAAAPPAPVAPPPVAEPATAPIVGVRSDADDLARLPVATARFWSLLRPMVDRETRALGDRVLRAMVIGKLKVGPRPGQVLIEQLAGPDRMLVLHGHPVHFLSAVDFATQLDEIFCQRHYAFVTGRERPLILDCGANTGVASLFFKLAHPGARVIAYEPNAAAAAVFRQNMASFGFSDVELREAAVSATEGSVVFNDCVEMPMASSVGTRMADLGYEVQARTVPAVSIAPDLADGADFLKVDIEGAEYEVLPALAPVLPAVERLFCEFHFGDGLARSALTRSLALLDDAGLEWVYTLAQPGAPSPFMNRPGSGTWYASANLWARRPAPTAG